MSDAICPNCNQYRSDHRYVYEADAHSADGYKRRGDEIFYRGVILLCPTSFFPLTVAEEPK